MTADTDTRPPRLFRREPAAPAHPLVDVHVHLGPSDTGELYYPLLTGEEYLDLADVAGVTTAFAFSPQRDGYATANAELRTWAAGTDGRVRPFARLGGPRVPVTLPALWQVRRALNARLRTRPRDVDTLDGFAGVKLLPHLDGLPSAAMLAEVRASGLPVLVHGGVHIPPRWIARHLVDQVGGVLIIGHLGSYPGAEPELRGAVELAREHDHVYLETSGAWGASFVRYAVAEVGHKVLFGSDAPLVHPAVAWEHVASAVRDDDALAAIGHRNAEHAGLV